MPILATPPQGIYVPPRLAEIAIAGSDCSGRIKSQSDVVLSGIQDELQINPYIAALGLTANVLIRFLGTIKLSGPVELGGISQAVYDCRAARLVNQYGYESLVTADIAAIDTIIQVASTVNAHVGATVWIYDDTTWATKIKRTITAVGPGNQITVNAAVGAILTVANNATVTNGFHYLNWGVATNNVEVFGGIWDGNDTLYQPRIGAHAENAMMDTQNVQDWLIHDLQAVNSRTGFLCLRNRGIAGRIDLNSIGIGSIQNPPATYATDNGIRLLDCYDSLIDGVVFRDGNLSMGVVELDGTGGGGGTVRCKIKNVLANNVNLLVRLGSSVVCPDNDFSDFRLIVDPAVITAAKGFWTPTGRVSIRTCRMSGVKFCVAISGSGAVDMSRSVVEDCELDNIPSGGNGITAGHSANGTLADSLSIQRNKVITVGGGVNTEGIEVAGPAAPPFVTNPIVRHNYITGFVRDLDITSCTGAKIGPNGYTTSRDETTDSEWLR